MVKRTTVFGGTGKSGKALISRLLSKGYNVTALVRNEQNHTLPADENLNIVQGSLLCADDVKNCLKTAGAVFCVFGPRPPYTDIFCHDATKIIIKAMADQGIPRLLCQTGAMIGKYPNRTLFFQWMTNAFQSKYGALAKDRDNQETAVKTSALQWTIIKPPLITQRPACKITAGPDTKIGLLSSISAFDLAEFLVSEMEQNRFISQSVFVKNIFLLNKNGR